MLAWLALVFFPPVVLASLDPLTGARVSLVTTQTSMAAPFLPNLESTRAQVGTQAAYLVSRLKSEGETIDAYSGAFTGFGIGASYSPALNHGVGWYIGALANHVSGHAKTEVASIADHEFTTTGLVGNLGYSARLVGRDDGAFLIGIFGGPSLLHFMSELKIKNETFRANPFLYGGTAGLQVRLRVLGLELNPYVMRFQTLQKSCVGLAGPNPVYFPDNCPGRPGTVDLSPSFTGYGLVFGLPKLTVNVYSTYFNHQKYRDIHATNFAVSYTF